MFQIRSASDLETCKGKWIYNIYRLVLIKMKYFLENTSH